MPRIFLAVFMLTLIMGACSISGLAPETIPPTNTGNASTEIVPSATNSAAPTDEVFPSLTPEVPPPTEIIATVSTPEIEQAPDDAVTEAPSRPQDCGYQWAYQDLPELSADFQAAIKALQAEAQANLFAFGENCVRNDGSTSFIPMETDFNVTLQVSDLANESDLGEWTVKVMQVIESIPTEEIVGPRPGRVSIGFQAHAEKGGVAFYINQYHDLPAGLSNLEIYQALKSLQ